MTLDTSRIQALFFDVDGTLRDTDDQYVALLSRWLHPFHIVFNNGDPSQFARRAILALESPGTVLYSLPDRLGIDNHLHAIADRMFRMGLYRKSDSYWIVPHVQEIVETLSHHYPLAVISARSERSTLGFLRQFELLSYFQCVATAYTCKHTKPYPDPVLWAAKQIGVSPSVCLMTGDTTVDVRAGKAAGAQTIGVLSGFGRVRELRNAGASLILDSVAELPEVLLQGRSNGKIPPM